MKKLIRPEYTLDELIKRVVSIVICDNIDDAPCYLSARSVVAADESFEDLLNASARVRFLLH